MSYQEKRTIISLISTLLISGFYFLYVYQRYQEGSLDTQNIFHWWGLVILIYILVTIVVQIVLYIGFTIINTIVTHEKEPDFTDELDQLIELKSTRLSHYVFMMGFLLAMLSQVIELAPSWLFIILIISGLLSSVVADLSQLYFYRRGV